MSARQGEPLARGGGSLPLSTFRAAAPRVLTCVAVVAMLLGASPAAAESRFALSVGHNLGRATDEPLRWAERDAERMDALLGQLGGVPEDRRILLRGEGPASVRLALARMQGRIEEARRAGERTVLFFYYSGHGDEAALRMGGEAFPLVELQRLLAETPSTVTVAVLDACHSGAMVRGRAKGLTSAWYSVAPRSYPSWCPTTRSGLDVAVRLTRSSLALSLPST